MPANVGYTFQPGGSQDTRMQSRDGVGASPISPQEAVKILSLRIPERAQGGIAPLPLLTSPGLTGTTDAGDLGGLLTALIAAFGKKPRPGGAAVDNGLGTSPRGSNWQPPISESGRPPSRDQVTDLSGFPHFTVGEPKDPWNELGQTLTAPTPTPVEPLPIPEPSKPDVFGGYFGDSPPMFDVMRF
jgi:hypothetical protein